VLDRSVEKVSHRGFVYPARFSWTWTRTDGLEVHLEVVVDEEEGPTPTEVTVKATEGKIGSADYRLPFASMTRMAAAQYAVRVTEPSDRVYRVSPAPAEVELPMGLSMDQVRGHITQRTDTARLEKVAELYRRARAEGRGVTELIEVSETVTTTTAYGLIGEARRAGLLPPSRPGRKRKEKG
jgi:hypothetical protein